MPAACDADDSSVCERLGHWVSALDGKSLGFVVSDTKKFWKLSDGKVVQKGAHGKKWQWMDKVPTPVTPTGGSFSQTCSCPEVVVDHPFHEEHLAELKKCDDSPQKDQDHSTVDERQVLQQKVREVFKLSGYSEINAKSFRKVWNSVFPNEKLEFKHYGYHDAKGQLADMAVVAQVGKSQKYVLKTEADKRDVEVAPAVLSLKDREPELPRVGLTRKDELQAKKSNKREKARKKSIDNSEEFESAPQDFRCISAGDWARIYARFEAPREEEKLQPSFFEAFFACCIVRSK